MIFLGCVVLKSVKNRVLSEKMEKRGFFWCFFLKLFLLLHIFTNVEDETMILYFPSKQCFKMGYSKYFVHVCIFDGYLAHRRKIYAFFRTKYTKYHKNPVSPEIRTRLKSLPNLRKNGNFVKKIRFLAQKYNFYMINIHYFSTLKISIKWADSGASLCRRYTQ